MSEGINIYSSRILQEYMFIPSDYVLQILFQVHLEVAVSCGSGSPSWTPTNKDAMVAQLCNPCEI